MTIDHPYRTAVAAAVALLALLCCTEGRAEVTGPNAVRYADSTATLVMDDTARFGDVTVTGSVFGSLAHLIGGYPKGYLELLGDSSQPHGSGVIIRSNHEVLIGCTNPTWGAVRLDVCGADIGIAVADNEGDGTRKQGGLAVRHYLYSEDPVGLVRGDALAGQNIMRLGGGYIGLNAVTLYEFHAASNTTTKVGDVVAELDVHSFRPKVPVVLPAGAPSSSGAACAAGQLAFDSAYVYVCTAADSWKRAAFTSF